ncbi:hypothetical protein D3C83_22870 [compost metagenome]
MRDAAVVVKIFDRPEVAEDEIEIGCGGREKTDQQAPPQRQRFLVSLGRRCRPRQQRA